MKHDLALLIVDIQTAFFDNEDMVFRGEQVVATVERLIDRAREAGIPIIYVQHNGRKGGSLENGSTGWEIYHKIAPRNGDIIVQKHTPDSFLNTDLESELSSRGIKKLILMGFQSDFCIDTTCRRAWSLGYDITLVKDGHSTYDSPHLKAEQIVYHHSYILGSFAKVVDAADIDLPIEETGL